MSTKNTLLPSVLLCLTMVSTCNASGKLDFCEAGSDCNDGGVVNLASVVVTKVKVTQLAGANNCPEVEKTHSENLISHTASSLFTMETADPKTYFTLKLLKACPYHIKFSTTAGCIGDKDAKISLDNQNNKEPRTWALLKGACGTLKANTAYVESIE